MRKRSVAQVRPGPAQAARRRLCVVDGRRAAPHPGRGAPAPHPGGASRAAEAGKVAAPKAPPIEFGRRVAHRREQYRTEASPCPPSRPPAPQGAGGRREAFGHRCGGDEGPSRGCVPPPSPTAAYSTTSVKRHGPEGAKHA